MIEDDRPEWVFPEVPSDIAAKLYRFKVDLGGESKANIDMSSNLNVDYDTLQEDMAQLPGEYAFVSSVFSEAKAMVAVIERAIKIKRGQLAEKIIDMAREQKVKLSEKVVLAIIEKDEQLGRLENKLIIAQKHAGKLYHLLKLKDMKFEIMRSLAGFKKQDFKNA